MSVTRKRTRAQLVAIMPPRRYRKVPYSTAVRRRTFVRGKDRVGGFYNRFNGDPAKEYKFLDSDIVGTSVSSSGVIFDSVNKIVQGVGESERVGRKVVIRELQFRWHFTIPAQNEETSPLGGDGIRMIWFIDKQCNGAVTTTASLLANLSFHSPLNLENSDRFVILVDRIYTMNYNWGTSESAGTVTQGGVMTQKVMKKKLWVPIEYSGTTAIMANIRSNNIGMMFITLNQRVTVNGETRIRYSDC